MLEHPKDPLYLPLWREVSPEQLLPSIGRFIRRNAKKHGVAIPNELKEYLEQLEASSIDTDSESVASSLAVATASDALITEGTSTSLHSSDGFSTSLDEAAALKATIESVFATLEKVICKSNGMNLIGISEFRTSSIAERARCTCIPAPSSP